MIRTIAFGFNNRKLPNWAIISLIDSVTLESKKNTIIKDKKILGKIFTSVIRNKNYNLDNFSRKVQLVRIIFKKEI